MSTRTNLDDFVSIHCFKAAIRGMEDILGVEGASAALISAGRQRGVDVAAEAGLTGKNPPVDTLAAILDGALGIHGTRLCQVSEVSSLPGGGYVVKTHETVCTAGEPTGSTRTCTYTMGAIMGFLEAVSGTRLTGKHTNNILSGSPSDDFVFQPL